MYCGKCKEENETQEAIQDSLHTSLSFVTEANKRLEGVRRAAQYVLDDDFESIYLPEDMLKRLTELENAMDELKEFEEERAYIG